MAAAAAAATAPITMSTTAFAIVIAIFSALFTFSVEVRACIGVNYGRLGSNLPTPSQVARFIPRRTMIDCVKLFDADPSTLQAFAGTGISVNVAVPNDLIPSFASLRFSSRWFQANILPYVAATNISRILIGNEVASPAADAAGNLSKISSSLVPAMQNLHTVLSSFSLQDRIKISSPLSVGVLSTSFPPSSGKFREGYDTEVIKPLLSFLKATSSPLMVSAYPFFDFTPETLDYALFQPNSGVIDRNTGLIYTNMLDAQLDAVFSAAKLLGFDVGGGGVDVVVAETGWPSAGEAWETGASVENARYYNGNLFRHVSSGAGTPLMPNRTFETYVFAVFDEDLKPGPASERSFGLFHPDLTPVYDIGILRTQETGEPKESMVVPAPATPQPPSPPAAAAADEKRWCVAKPDAVELSLQENIEFACAQGIGCGQIQEGGACNIPDTIASHASFAMNEYYQAFGKKLFDCYFGDTGMITTTDPSYGSCLYS